MNQLPGRDPKERRRSRRILARVPLQIELGDGPRDAMAIVINLHGCLFLSPTPVPHGTLLRITNIKNNCVISGRVIWIGGEDASGSHKFGIEFEAIKSAMPDFWGSDYDPKGEEAS